MEIPVEHGLWIAVRCKAGDLQVEHPNDRSDLNAWRYKEGLETRIANVRAILEEIRDGMD